MDNVDKNPPRLQELIAAYFTGGPEALLEELHRHGPIPESGAARELDVHYDAPVPGVQHGRIDLSKIGPSGSVQLYSDGSYKIISQGPNMES